MNNDYLENQNKYMYAFCRRDEKDVYNNNYHNTITEALNDALSMTFFMNAPLPEKLKIAVCERGNWFKPSECNAFDEDAMEDLLDKSDNMLSADFKGARLFNLSYEEIQELRKLINDFLDQKLDTGYQLGKFIEIITLTREQYTKYL